MWQLDTIRTWNYLARWIEFCKQIKNSAVQLSAIQSGVRQREDSHGTLNMSQIIIINFNKLPLKQLSYRCDVVGSIETKPCAQLDLTVLPNYMQKLAAQHWNAKLSLWLQLAHLHHHIYGGSGSLSFSPWKHN